MPENPKPVAENTPQPEALRRIAEAHRILRALQVPLEKHPDLEQAIDNLEMALSILTTKTAGML